MVEEAPSNEAPAAPQLEPPLPRHGTSMKPLAHHLGSDRGTAVVEFAIIALPLCLILFGILDFGRALNYYNDVTQLAGQGARAAAVNTNIDGTTADSTFQSKLAAQNDSPELTNKVQVCIQTVPTGVGQPVTVKVSYRFHFNAIIASIPITLSSTQSERSETGSPSYTATCSPATLP